MSYTDNLLSSERMPVNYHFIVTFLTGGVAPNPVDIFFQKVSGLSQTIETEDIRGGGQNHFTYKLPQMLTHDNLVLERGIQTDSPLNMEFNEAMSAFQFSPGNVIVASLNKDGLPLTAWIFLKTYPVSWAVTDMDAGDNSLMIETMELAYTRQMPLRV